MINDEEEEVEEDVVNMELIKQLICLICGDNHGRDLSWHINNVQKSNYAVGFIKPDGRTREMLNKKNIKEANLEENDVLVLLCGANDVARIEAKEALEVITATLNKTSHAKVLIVNIPNR